MVVSALRSVLVWRMSMMKSAACTRSVSSSAAPTQQAGNSAPYRAHGRRRCATCAAASASHATCSPSHNCILLQTFSPRN